MNLRVLATLTVLAVAIAGCTGPTEGSLKAPMQDGSAGEDTAADAVLPQTINGSTGSVGGAIKNSAPSVPTFAPDSSTGENRGTFTVTFTGTIRDANTEKQLSDITVLVVGPSTISPVTKSITADEKDAAAEPAAFTNGWKVWTGTGNDGVLNFKYQYAFPAFLTPGAYAFTARATDTSGAAGTSAPATVTLTSFSDITVSTVPVSATGEVLAGQNWGQWEAEAGASNVASSNYMKLVNTGDVANARVVLDFAQHFTGSDDPGFIIPAGSNVQFAWWEDTTPATSAPDEGTYEWLPEGGTVTIDFTGVNHVAYVTYRVVQLPEVLPVQPYGITFTVTDLADL